MMFPNNSYAEILRRNRIHYVPSCLIVEMMTKLYGQISLIPAEKIRELMPDTTAMLRALGENLCVTAEAYEQNRIGFFVGDWKDDKQRARKLFFNLMVRLGSIGERVDAHDRRELGACAEELSERWTSLERTVERKCNELAACGGECNACRYFRSVHPGCWQQIMANILMALHVDTVHDDPEAYLILLCYNRIRTQLVRVIKDIEKKNTVAYKFPVHRILVVSGEDTPVSCPKCTLMVDSMKKEGSNNAAKCRLPAPAPRRERISLKRVTPLTPSVVNRYLMPSSLGRLR